MGQGGGYRGARATNEWTKGAFDGAEHQWRVSRLRPAGTYDASVATQ